MRDAEKEGEWVGLGSLGVLKRVGGEEGRNREAIRPEHKLTRGYIDHHPSQQHLLHQHSSFDSWMKK